jgi:hypothetical protein
MRLSFPGSFSLVRFFWRSKRNEHQLKKEGCPFETPPREEPGSGAGKIKTLRKESMEGLVGCTGVEPVTPTLSR